MRFVRPTRESLDGFVIGALGAICFTSAAMLTRLAPQFATGLFAGDRPISDLLIQAGLQGVAVPLIATSLGGLVGAALWFRRPKLIVSSVLVTLVVFGALGLLELAPVSEGVQFVAYVVATVIALLALRIGLQITLLHEKHGPIDSTHTGHGWLFRTLGAGVIVAVRGRGDGGDAGHADPSAVYLPAGLRASSDRRADRPESTLLLGR